MVLVAHRLVPMVLVAHGFVGLTTICMYKRRCLSHCLDTQVIFTHFEREKGLSVVVCYSEGALLQRVFVFQPNSDQEE